MVILAYHVSGSHLENDTDIADPLEQMDNAFANRHFNVQRMDK